LVEHQTCDQEVKGLTLGWIPLACYLGQVVHTRASELSSIMWCLSHARCYSYGTDKKKSDY